MHVVIARECPDAPDAIQLIGEIEAFTAPMYPHDKEHGLSPSQMVNEGVIFFSLHCDGALAGCGGLNCHGKAYAEIMRMYVRPRFRGRGLGMRMLEHLESYACEHGVRALRLKTGIYQVEALGLYERSGYRLIPPFGLYREHPLNRYYEKRLSI